LKIALNWQKCPVFPSEGDMDKPGSPIPTVDFNFVSVKGAAYQCGYNIQYLRRMLRAGALKGSRSAKYG
jgi:hypothetical protein